MDEGSGWGERNDLDEEEISVWMKIREKHRLNWNERRMNAKVHERGHE